MSGADVIASSGGDDGGDNGRDVDGLHDHEQIIPAKDAIDEEERAGDEPDHPR